MRIRFLTALAVAIVASSFAGATRAEPVLQAGTYAVTFRLEVPHVEAFAVDQTTTVCIKNLNGDSSVSIPVLSGNNPLSRCPAKNIRTEAGALTFDIICPGRDGALAHARYTLKAGTFSGRIAMKMGGKNMTFVEVQSGRRTGNCAVASASAN